MLAAWGKTDIAAPPTEHRWPDSAMLEDQKVSATVRRQRLGLGANLATMEGMLPEGVHLLQGRGFATSAYTAAALDRTLRGMQAEGLL